MGEINTATADEPCQAATNAFLSSAVRRVSRGIAHELSTPIQYISDNLRFIESFLDAGKEHRDSDTATTDESRSDAKAAVGESLEGIHDIRQIHEAFRWLTSEPSHVAMSCDVSAAMRHMVEVTRNEWKSGATLLLHAEPRAVVCNWLAAELKVVVIAVMFGLCDHLRSSSSPGTGVVTLSIDVEAVANDVAIRVRGPQNWLAGITFGDALQEMIERHRIYEPVSEQQSTYDQLSVLLIGRQAA